MPEVSIDEQVACVQREIGFREKLYPRWVKDGKLTQGNADLELARMRAVLATVSGSAPPLIPGEADIRRSERLKVLEIAGRHMHSGSYIRVEAAVRRELGS